MRPFRNGLLGLALAGTPLQASLFQAVGGQLQATAHVPVNSQDAFLPVIPPGPGSNQASIGMVTSAIGYQFADAVFQSRLDLTWDYSFGYPGSGAQAFTYSDVHFSAPAGTSYMISGLFSVPPGQHPLVLQVDASIIASTGGTIFHHATTRSVSGGSSIVIGVPVPGDTFTGSAMGMLSPGTVYTVALDISSGNNMGDVVIASGSFSVVLQNTTCYANCDGSTISPVLNVNDFACFINRYAAGDSYANCDGSTAPPLLNVNDFICFQGRFAAGCP